MKNIPKAIRYVIIITFIYCIILVVLFVTKTLITTDLSKIFVSLGAGLTGWLITHAFTNWLSKDDKECIKRVEANFREYLEAKFPPHNGETQQILKHVLHTNSITLVEKKRKDIGYNSLQDIFRSSRSVKISGIACKSLIKDLLEINDHALLESLIKNPGVKVDILINDPKAEHIGFKDAFEEIILGRVKPCSKGIEEAIANVVKLGKKLKEVPGKLKSGCLLQIRMTKIPLNSTLNYIEYQDSSTTANPWKEKMLIGFIFTHIEGSDSAIYEVAKVDKENNINVLFKNALDNYNGIFNDTATLKLLRWDHTGVEVTYSGEAESA